MHVVHIVCTDAFAGVERYVLDSALNLAAAGCSVTVIGGAEASLRARLASAGLEWLPGAGVRSALRSLRSVDRPDVLVTHMTRADLAGALASRRLRAPVVSVRHFASRRGSNGVYRLIAGWIARHIAAQIAISEFVAANVEGSVTVIHTGVDDVAVHDAQRENSVLVAQRLEEEKFTEIALRAWAQTSDRAGWTLLVAGDGAQRPALESLSKELGIADTVEFLGFRADLDRLMSSASVYLAPTPREGLGIAVLEAMANAIPVVAARGGGHLESVGAVASPAMFAPGDEFEAARQLERLIGDAGERRRFGLALRDKQQQEFNVRDQTARTLGVLGSVVRPR